MAGEPQALAWFPGITQIVDGSITVVQGIGPSVAILTIAPQLNLLADSGTLVFAFAGATREWPDAKVDYASLELTDQGYIWRLAILDRRWKWSSENGGGWISGRYNVWRDNFTLEDGTVDPAQANTQTNTIDTERTPRELARLCLRAMGEDNYDTSALPDDARPSVDWDFDNPAEALARLCDHLGCRVDLAADNSVVIVKVGEGADLPTDNILHPGYTFNPPEMPDRISVVTAPVRFQVDFRLEAVGLDSAYDDQSPRCIGMAPIGSQKPGGQRIRLLNDLSYAVNKNDPNNFGGFTWHDIANSLFFNVNRSKDGQDVTGLRDLARQSVGRYYRIVVPVKIPGLVDENFPNGMVTNREQLVLETELVNTWFDDFQQERNMPAQVFGVYMPLRGGNLNNNVPALIPPPLMPPRNLKTGERTIFYMGGFSVDAEHKLVIFDEPVFKNIAPISGLFGVNAPVLVTPTPAQLVLRCACSVRGPKTLAIERYVRWQDTGGAFGTQEKIVHHDEITFVVIPEYDADGYSSPQGTDVGAIQGDDPRQFSAVGTNKTDVDKECDFYLKEEIRQYENTEAVQLSYPGFRFDIQLDGAIQSLTFSFGQSGATTTATRNSEHLRAVKSYKQMRRQQQTKAVVRAAIANPRTQSNKVMGELNPGITTIV